MKQKTFLSIISLLFVTTGLIGCATVPSVVNGVDLNQASNSRVANLTTGPVAESYISNVNNDLYYIYTDGYGAKTRRLTNSPEIQELSACYHWKGAFITYYSEGHWYMQPFNGDDSNRQEISAAEMMKAE